MAQLGQLVNIHTRTPSPPLAKRSKHDHDYGSVRPYRSRRSRPCDYCRKRKARCITFADKSCLMCQKAGINCTFVAKPEKKRRAEPFAPGDSGSTGSGAVTVQSFAPAHDGPIGPAGGRDTSVHPMVNVPPMNQPPPKSDQPTSSEKWPPLIPDGFDSSILMGLSGDQDPFLLQYYKYEPSSEVYSFIKHAIRRVDGSQSMPVQFMSIQDAERQDRLRSEIQDQRRRVYSLAHKYEERLLALYFRFAYPTYPIVDREGFYHDYYHNKDNINIGLLAGLLALSCIWWKYDSVLCVNVMPKGLYSDLYEECRIAMEREARYPTIASVQCLLLLLQRRLQPSDTSETYYMYVDIARLVATSHNLGLHMDCSQWSISPALKKLRRRLWNTVYIMEKWTSVNTGRPSLLHWDNSTVFGYESSGQSQQLFAQMGRLTMLLDDISQELYSVRHFERRYFTVSQTRAKVDEFFDRLQTWRDNLPEDLRDMQVAPQGEFAKNGTLSLAALTIEVLLHKIRLQFISSGLVSKQQIFEDRAAAYETIERVIKFTSEITHSHLHAFWYSTTRLNFSTIAHFIFFHHVTSLTPQERKDTRETLRKWLFALRVLAQGWEEGTGLAALRMDGVFWVEDDLFDVERTPGLNGGMNFEIKAEESGPVAASAASAQQSSSVPVSGPRSSVSAVAAARASRAMPPTTNSGYYSQMQRPDQSQSQNQTQNQTQNRLQYPDHQAQDQSSEPGQPSSYIYPLGSTHIDQTNETSWHNPIDDDILLLNEDIMPQSDQTHLLQEDVPEDLANAYAEYFSAEKYLDEGLLTSDLHNIYQVHTNAGYTPEPTFD